MFKTILAWLRALFSTVTAPPPLVPSPTRKTTLVDIMLNWSRDFGPSLVTGGYLRKIDKTTAQVVSNVIYATALATGMEVEMLAAGIAGESRFDPHAFNPNNQDAIPGESLYAAFLHADIGLCQFDGATLARDPEFSGKSVSYIIEKAFDPSWSVPKFAQHVNQLLIDASKEVASDPTLLDHVKDRDIRILAVEGYNKGEHGARLAEQHKAYDPKAMSYGEAWMQRYHDYKALLNPK